MNDESVLYNAELNIRQIPGDEAPPLLVRVDADSGKRKLIDHQHAARILADNAFRGELRCDPHTMEWHRYHHKTGIFQQEPALVSESAVFLAIRRLSGDFPFGASYVQGVTKCLTWQSVAEITPAPGTICFTNGALDLETMRLSPHSPKYGFRSSLPFAWEPNAAIPDLVLEWLKDAVGGKDDQVELLRAFLNAAITGRADLQRFLELVGFGGSGKGTYIRLLTSLLGNDAVHSTTLKELETNRFETAKLLGKKLVVITDAEKWRGDVSMLKSITGQDPIRFEQKHRQAGSNFTYGGMVLIAANQHLESTDYSSGIQRRRITVNFNHVVPSHHRRDLNAEFEPFLPAVAAWALSMPRDQVTDYLRNTSAHVASLAEARIGALTATNPVAAWMIDNCIFDERAKAQIGVKRRLTLHGGISDGDRQAESRVIYEFAGQWLYPNYVTWCEEHGKNPVAHNLFSNTLVDVAKNMLGKDVEKLRHRKDGAWVRGLRLRGVELVTNYDDLVTNYDDLVTNYVIESDKLDELSPFSKVSEKNPREAGINSDAVVDSEKNSKVFSEMPKVRQLQHNQQLSSSPARHGSSPSWKSSSPAPMNKPMSVGNGDGRSTPLQPRLNSIALFVACTGASGADINDIVRQINLGRPKERRVTADMIHDDLAKLLRAELVQRGNGGRWIAKGAA